MQQRVALSKRVRFEVFKRDNFSCQYCGRHPPNVLLEVDHIIPVADGGGSEEENLLTACFACNRGKGAVPLSVAPKSLAEKAADIAEREEQLAGYRVVMEAKAKRVESDMWKVAAILAFAKDGEKFRFNRDWLRSIKNFNEKLPFHEVMDAAELAAARVPYSDRRRFLYFCKVCWNKVTAGEAE